MAKERDVSPEKQLLRLIEDPTAENRGKFQAKGVKHRGLSLFSPGAWVGRVSFLRGKFKEWVNSRRDNLLGVKVINDVLGSCIVILLFYLAYSLYFSIINLNKMPDLGIKSQGSSKTVSFPEVSVLKKSPTYYLERVKRRNIFRIGGADKVDLTKVFAPVAPSRLLDEISHLRLVGISWSDDPDAMIEDTNTMRTFFVKRGQMVERFKVEAIFKDKVILTYGGEEVELK